MPGWACSAPRTCRACFRAHSRQRWRLNADAHVRARIRAGAQARAHRAYAHAPKRAGGCRRVCFCALAPAVSACVRLAHGARVSARARAAARAGLRDKIRRDARTTSRLRWPVSISLRRCLSAPHALDGFSRPGRYTLPKVPSLRDRGPRSGSP